MPTSGCGVNGAAVGYQPSVHIASFGLDRTYSVYVPAGYDPSYAYPIIFAFHGDGGTGDGLRNAFPIEAQSSDNAIFVYPDATLDSGRTFDVESPYASNADMNMFSDVLGSLTSSYCVDQNRVFATGVSRGAYFVNFLNCRVGTNALRAIAAQSGSGPYGGPYDSEGHMVCDAPSAAALLIHGDADYVVPYTDGLLTYDRWAWSNGCQDTASPVGFDPCVLRDGCLADRPVIWCGIQGMGHEIWSSAPQAVWTFFSSFQS